MEAVLTPADQRQKLIDDFHRLWYDSATKGQTWGSTGYFGTKLWKMPSDLWLYQELLWEIRPALIVETGTAFGGSALYFAHLLDQLGSGRVLSIDLEKVQKNYPHHPRIEYMGGKSSTDERRIHDVWDYAEWFGDQGGVMVVLDSDHSMLHVKAEFNAYSGLVTPSSYLVVEDTNIGGHPVYPEFGQGPYEAVEAWLPKHPEFVVDARLPSRMLFSMHTWLRRERT